MPEIKMGLSVCLHINDAIAREKQLKAGSQQKKLDLINSQNPVWRDLYEDLV